MNVIRLSGLLQDRYKTKFFGLINKFSLPVLGYSLTPCSYPNNLSSRPLRDCSMHSPLRIKIQNAINKALQLETADVLVVGGRRRNRKRKRKHGKDKRKSKKYEGKETPILKAKTYSGDNGKYIALLAEDDISLSPSMVDDLLDGNSVSAISLSHEDDDEEQDDEMVFDIEKELDNADNRNKKSLQEEITDMINSETTYGEERHSSCDTGYNSEEDHRLSRNSENNDAGDDETEDQEHSLSNTNENTVEEDEVFQSERNEKVECHFVPDHYLETDDVFLVKPKTAEFSEELANNVHGCGLDQECENLENTNEEQTMEPQTVSPTEKFSVEDLYTEEPRLTINFEYDEEEEQEIYTKQPRSWHSRKTEEDEELTPLICCGDEKGVGFACCTIL